jgi:hypothetical protein
MANKPKPAKKIRNTSPAAGAEFNFAEYKKAILADPRARKVVEDFLKYRHREWELGLENDITASRETQAGQKRKS